MAQQLADAVSAASLAHLRLHGLSGGGGTRWGGPACELLVADDAPHLLQIADTVAAQLSRPGHEVRPRARPGRELRARRAQSDFCLLLDFVRPVGQTANDAVLALLTASNPALVRQPPEPGSTDLRRVAQTLPVGVIGELRIEGARIDAVQELVGWNLAAVWRK